jgi:PKD repeat protein
MTMKRAISLLILMAFFSSAWAQPVDDPCHRSTEGTDFWFGFMEHMNLRDHFLEIRVTAREATTFTLTYGPRETPLGGPYNVNPGRSVPVNIPWETLEHFGSESIENKGIHLVSEKPVNLFAMNWDQNSSDAAVIFPTPSLGMEYYAMCYTPYPKPDDNGRNTEFLIVATQDTTTLQITPSVNTHDNKHLKGEPWEITLHRGQSYQVQSMNNTNWPGQGDLTGSYVRSDKPVAFFSGSMKAIVPSGALSHTGDHLYEQIPPVNTWGREFFTIPYRFRYWDRLRILAQEDHTIVWINGLKPDTLNRGEFRDTVLLHYQPKRIIAEKPVLIAQYSQSQSEDMGSFSGGNFEPFMIILPPRAQFRNSANFVVYELKQADSDYFINAVFPSSEINNIYLNDTRLRELALQDSIQYDIKWPSSSFGGNYYAQLKVDPGVYTLWIDNPDKSFYAYSYSYGQQESLGYSVSFNLDNLLDLGSSINFQKDTLVLCYGDSILLDAGWWFEEFRWNTGDTTQTIAAKDSGWFYVDVKDEFGCPQSDSVYVFLSRPVTNLGIDTSGCEPFALELDAGKVLKRRYSWNTGARTQTITADSTGRYAVTVTDSFGCRAYDEMFLEVFPIPHIDLLSDRVVCDKKSTEMKVGITYTNGSPWDLPLETTWWSDDPSVKLDRPTDTSVVVTVSEWGDYTVFYNALTPDRCDTTRRYILHFYPTPSATFEISGEDDLCADFNRKVLYTGDGGESTSFYWNFGPSLIVDSLDYPRNFRISLGIGTNPEISLVVEENGCSSDPNSLPLAGFPEEVYVEADPSQGCDSLEVSFSEDIPYTGIDYRWDFGDGSGYSGKNPDHTYQKSGFYDVSLTVTEQASNCKASYLFPDRIKIYPTPVVRFSGDPSLCYTDHVELHYLNSVDSTSFSWFVNGNLQETSGNDSLYVSLETPLTEVGLQVEEYGCVSEPVFKKFKRIPRVDFTIDKDEGCQPLRIVATGNSDEKEVTYYWWLENKLWVGRGNPYTYQLADTGYFDLGVRVASLLTGCQDTLIKKDLAWVHSTPTAAFQATPKRTYSDEAVIAFTNQSKNTKTYFWDFDDGETFEGKDPPLHIYNEVGTYHPVLIAGTEFDCLDTARATIEIIPRTLYAPNAFRPSSDIPENRFFMLSGKGINPDRFQLTIYDRWGQRVFESEHPDEKWDGTLQNGKPAPMGNYIWTAQY